MRAPFDFTVINNLPEQITSSPAFSSVFRLQFVAP